MKPGDVIKVKRPGPRGEVGDGKPGRNLRRRHPPAAGPIKAWARTTDEGRAWLRRKRAGR